MTRLTTLQVQLAEQLLISVVKKEPVIEYNEIATRVTPKIQNPRNVGREIGEISKLCHELNLPLLSAKVASKGTKAVGAGFYGIYEMFRIDTAGCSEKELFRLELKKIRECTEWYRLAEHLNLTIAGLSVEIENKQICMLPKEVPIYPDDISPIEQKTYVEGAKKEITVNAYERNPAARKECIKEHGCRCIICGFDFGAFYGEQFFGGIHVHHKIPLYLSDKAYELDPTKDLVPVCPNCHMILHAKEDGVYTIEEVAEFISQNR